MRPAFASASSLIASSVPSLAPCASALAIKVASVGDGDGNATPLSSRSSAGASAPLHRSEGSGLSCAELPVPTLGDNTCGRDGADGVSLSVPGMAGSSFRSTCANASELLRLGGSARSSRSGRVRSAWSGRAGSSGNRFRAGSSRDCSCGGSSRDCSRGRRSGDGSGRRRQIALACLDASQGLGDFLGLWLKIFGKHIEASSDGTANQRYNHKEPKQSRHRSTRFPRPSIRREQGLIVAQTLAEIDPLLVPFPHDERFESPLSASEVYGTVAY